MVLKVSKVSKVSKVLKGFKDSKGFKGSKVLSGVIGALRAALRLIKARNFAVCEIVAKFAVDGIPQHTA